LVFDVPVLSMASNDPVLAALLPERVMFAKSPVKPVAVDAISKAPPEVNELALYVNPVVVVPVKFCVQV